VGRVVLVSVSVCVCVCVCVCVSGMRSDGLAGWQGRERKSGDELTESISVVRNGVERVGWSGEAAEAFWRPSRKHERTPLDKTGRDQMIKEPSIMPPLTASSLPSSLTQRPQGCHSPEDAERETSAASQPPCLAHSWNRVAREGQGGPSYSATPSKKVETELLA